MRRMANVRRARPGVAAAFLALAPVLVFIAGKAAAQKPAVTETKSIEVTAQPIAGFDTEDVDRQSFGRLRWRGGLVFKSPAAEFGGWSGLVLDPSGHRLLAISDNGAWLTAELTYQGPRPAGLRDARIGPLQASNGKLCSRGCDSEAVALVEGSLRDGTVLVGFERNHRIGQFQISENGLSRPLNYLERPEEARRMRSNEGFEAVSVLRAGRFKGSTIAFAEALTDERGYHIGWIWTEGEPRKLYLVDIDGFDITDATPLDDGGLLLLERRFRWMEGVKMRLRLIAPEEIGPGAVMRGEVLFQADMRYQIDNMEGVAAHRGEHGETVVTLISDDNFNPVLQRTLLLQFTLKNNGED